MSTHKDMERRDPVEEVIYRISHDLRGSTRALSELPIWIEEDMRDAGVALPDSVAQSLTLLQTHAQRLNLMIEGLLMHSRVAREPAVQVNAAERLERRMRALHLPEGVQLRWALRPADVAVAPADLELALQVMLDNAVLHGAASVGQAKGGAGARKARIAVLGQAVCGFWVLTMRDGGVGIPLKHQAEIFKPMVVLHGASEGKGVGMGLAILDKIARHAGGSAFVAPQKRAQHGATVCLCLPIL